MQTITLSNDPKTGFTREATDMEFNLNERNRTCTLDLNIHYKKDGQTIMTKGFTFTATDAHMVNAQGDVVPAEIENPDYDPEVEGSNPTIPNPEAVKTEYQHFEDLQYAPVSTAQIKEAVVRVKEANGVFDV